MSYLTYSLHSSTNTYKIMTNQQDNLLQEKIKLEIVWFNIDIIWYKQLPSNIQLQERERQQS